MAEGATGTVGNEQVIEQLLRATRDSNIKAVQLRILVLSLSRT